MAWTRSEAIALALPNCAYCVGLGLRKSRQEHVVCNCVLRAVFNAVYRAFRERAELRWGTTRAPHGGWSFTNEEFLADVVLLSRRTLGADSLSWRLFRYHYLLGADWKLCCGKLGMTRGAFFHEVYRIQQRLGRAYHDTEPHALYPVDEYFTPASSAYQRPRAA
jgi:hypothetical protein